MKKENISKKIEILGQLAQVLREKNTEDNDAYLYAKAKNPWFSLDFIIYAFDTLINEYLQKSKLENWLSAYTEKSIGETKNVGIIVAGNIPVVGIHDILCAYFSEHHVTLKLSSKDDVLMNYILKEWANIDAQLMQQITISESLKNIDAIIATGSDTTHNYFEQYFKSVKKILRKNRNSIAVLSGNETDEELYGLADDIFLYYGLGCRNISYLLAPKDFEIIKLYKYFEKYVQVKQHVKYMNNFEYNLTLLLMNQKKHFASDFFILEENAQLSSRIATLHYSHYENIDEVKNILQINQDKIQCVVSSINELKNNSVAFGQTQYPSLSQYADNIDTLDFLINL